MFGENLFSRSCGWRSFGPLEHRKLWDLFFAHRIHGNGRFTYDVYHKNQSNVGKYLHITTY